jgi:5-methylcytosine-specific restriction endonuclease McrA
MSRPGPKPYVWTKEAIEAAVAQCSGGTLSGVCRAMGKQSNGNTHGRLRAFITKYEIDISVLRKRYESQSNKHHGSRRATSTLRNILLRAGVPQVCALCGNDGMHNGKPLVLQVDHANGNSGDDTLANLRFLCSNCHSQTDTFNARNSVYHTPTWLGTGSAGFADNKASCRVQLSGPGPTS